MTTRRPPSGLSAAWAIASKDLNILRSDKMTVLGLLGMPLLFAIFFGTIFGGSGGDGGEIRPMQIAVVTPLPSDEARTLLARLEETDGLEITQMDREQASTSVRKGERAAMLEILEVPDTAGMLQGDRVKIRVGTDPSQQPTRGLLQGLLTSAISKLLGSRFSDTDEMRGSLDQMADQLKRDEDTPLATRILLSQMFENGKKMLDASEQLGDGDPTSSGPSGFTGGFQPDLEFENVSRQSKRKISSYEISFPQAMAWALMSGAAALALTLVKERRAGTLLRLRTSPIGGNVILLGKTLACAVTGVAVLAFLLVFGALTFGVRVPDPLTLGLAVVTSALSFAAMGTFMATLGRTEEAVSGISWGILMVIAMLGGGMVPTMFMPDWMETMSVVSPVRWAIHSLEGAIWRGYSVTEMATSLGILTAFGLVFGTLGWARMRHLRS